MAGPTLFRPDDIPTGLIGYWKFNNDATDEQGAYDLTAVNTPTYVASGNYWKDAYSTDLVAASSMYFTVTDANPLDLVDAFTIAGWIKCDDITTTTIIDKGSGATGWCVKIDGSSKLVLNMNNGARATSATALVVGKWNHFVARYTQTTADIFIDGNLDISSAYSTDCQATATDLYIAVEDDASTAFFDGKMADIAIWSAALTPIQIKSLAMGVDLDGEAYRPDDVSTAPDHWFPLNELSGVRNDSAGSVVLSDSSTVLSKGGYVEGVSAYINRGASEYLYAADAADWDLGGDFTISTWMYITTAQGDSSMIGICGHSSGGGGWAFSYMYYAAAASRLFRFQNTGGTTLDFNNTTVLGKISIGNWYHVAFKRDGDDWYVYLDGEEVETINDNDAVNAPAVPFYVGYSGGLVATAGDNRYQDFALWNGYACTVAEIAKLASAFPIQQTGIINYWKLDEESGSRIDAIGSNDLTDNNSVLYTAGTVDNAALFDDANSEYLSDSDATQWDFGADAFSVIAWHNNAQTGTYSGLIEIGTYPNSINMQNANSAGYQFDAFVNATRCNKTAVVAASTWYHFGLVRSDPATTYSYLDAISLGTTAASGSVDVGQIWIGRTTDDYADGAVDEVLIAKRWFRPEEMKSIYLKGLNGFEATSEPSPTPTASSVSLRRVFMIT